MLSPEQLRAMAIVEENAEHFHEIMLEAPAGSGKTTVVCELARRMNAKVITFTRKAAAELRMRGCDASTIYGLAAQATDTWTLANTVTEDVAEVVKGRWAKLNKLDTKTANALWPAHGPRFLTTEDWLANLQIDQSVVIVDEAQDCTAAEVQAIRDLGKHYVVWVCDPWQRIYEWRGAVGIDCAVVAQLTTNFRSTPEIVARACEISGRPEVSDQRADRNDRVAWLCRSHQDAQRIAAATGAHLVTGHDRRALADLQIEAAAEAGASWALAYRRYPSWAAATAALSWPLPDVAMRSPRQFLAWMHTHDLQDNLGLTRELVMTIHAAKGLQFEAVKVVGWKTMAREGEDRRLHYVAATRATHDLVEYPDCVAALKAAGGDQ